jgi:hypothetical protein
MYREREGFTNCITMSRNDVIEGTNSGVKITNEEVAYTTMELYLCCRIGEYRKIFVYNYM